jgi:hypothetical protein
MHKLHMRVTPNNITKQKTYNERLGAIGFQSQFATKQSTIVGTTKACENKWGKELNESRIQTPKSQQEDYDKSIWKSKNLNLSISSFFSQTNDDLL